MKIYIKYTFAVQDDKDLSADIKAQIESTIALWRDEYEFDPSFFCVESEDGTDEYAYFPVFYEDDRKAIMLIDKNQERSSALNIPRYKLMYVWELDDINTSVDSDNLAYEVFCMDKYYDQLKDVNTEGFTLIGKYDSMEGSLGLILPYHEPNKNMMTNNNSFSANQEAMLRYEKNFHLSSTAHVKEYLDFMGYDDEIIKRFHLGYVLSDDKDNVLADRLVYPWINLHGDVIGFCGRHLDTRNKGVFQKFVLSEGLRGYIDYELFGLYQAADAIKREDHVYVVNGYTDVISWSQKGIQNVVSCSGSSLSETQAKMLAGLTRNVTLICEAVSENACSSCMRSRDVLKSNGFNVQMIALPEYSDAECFARGKSLAEMKECLQSNIMTTQQFADMGYLCDDDESDINL